MPVYEYKCQKCGEQFEAVAPMHESNDDRPCFKCVATAMGSRIMSATPTVNRLNLKISKKRKRVM